MELLTPITTVHSLRKSIEPLFVIIPFSTYTDRTFCHVTLPFCTRNSVTQSLKRSNFSCALEQIFPLIFSLPFMAIKLQRNSFFYSRCSILSPAHRIVIIIFFGLRNLRQFSFFIVCLPRNCGKVNQKKKENRTFYCPFVSNALEPASESN